MDNFQVEKRVPLIFTYWVVSYMPCQFDKFDNNIKKKSRNTIKTWLCRQLMWQPWNDVTQSMSYCGINSSYCCFIQWQGDELGSESTLYRPILHFYKYGGSPQAMEVNKQLFNGARSQQWQPDFEHGPISAETFSTVSREELQDFRQEVAKWFLSVWPYQGKLILCSVQSRYEIIRATE